ncbi:hypothetical protein [Halobacterium wangiae]|uniref:hypothetical protein n=1 Tax=Halobacterium wangiae TaxID=2902623 RepID=UPI001E4E63EB|nr:hypothetical protein [Halobacterium wangiae]
MQKMMPSTRRTFLGLLGASSIGGLTGCSRFVETSPPPVTIEVGGQFENQHPVELEVLPETVESGLSENILYRGTFDVGPSGPEEAFTEIEDAFESQRATIRVSLMGVGVVEEYTFLPDCPRDATYDEVLYVTFHSPFTVAFLQNRCQ